MKNEEKLSLGKIDIQCLTVMTPLGNDAVDQVPEAAPMTITSPLGVTSSPLFC
ncbi:MAG: hypothetical protein GY940_33255 [bacterium]|nr:hypothetical protein [bacterium]